MNEFSNVLFPFASKRNQLVERRADSPLVTTSFSFDGMQTQTREPHALILTQYTCLILTHHAKQ